MLRIDWLLINHLLHLVGCTFIYLHKMHGHPHIKKGNTPWHYACRHCVTSVHVEL
jgi:hypothetical protein